MPTYFGGCDSSGNTTGTSVDANNSPVAFWNGGVAWTCPGSGNQTVKELSAHVYPTSGSPHVRCAIYTSAGTTKIAEGTAEVLATGSSPGSWQGHMAQSSITPNPATLVGGTSYLLCMGQDGDGQLYSDKALSSGGYYKSIDYTAGYPASLPTPDGTTGVMWPVRCGVDAAVSPTLDQEGFRWRDDDNDEANATWLASQDAQLTRAISTNTRLRVLLNAAGDPAASQFQLEWRLGSGTWRKVR